MKMGLGTMGLKTNVFKRKFRWTLGFTEICGWGNVEPSFLKTATRPKLEMEEVAVDFLNAKMYIPGKGVWSTMDIAYLDVATKALLYLWTWINSVYNILEDAEIETAKQKMGSTAKDYTGKGEMKLYDGCGKVLETWTLFQAWPKSIDFGELDMSSNDICEVKMTLRFARVGYQSDCLGFPVDTCCTGCGER